MRGKGGCLASLSGCLMKLVLWAIGATAVVWVFEVAMNPWALHIGGQATPLLYWHGSGTVVSKDGKSYPLYVSFWPGRPSGFHGGGRRNGKMKNADISGEGWLCISPGTAQRMNISGEMYGGYRSTEGSYMNFRLLEWKKAFQINYQHRGFFDVGGTWHGPDLVMDRPGEQGIRFQSGLLIDNATVTLRWAGYEEFEEACHSMGKSTGR
jgi:hypothetical protein